MKRKQSLWLAIACVLILLPAPGCGESVLLDDENVSSNAQALSRKEFSIYRSGNRFATDLGDHYLDRVQPVFAKRCVGCHSCTNGPCQLNMTSHAALKRGVNTEDPYAIRPWNLKDTRVSNNLSTQKWRNLGFKSILPGQESGLAPEESIIYRNLIRGRDNTPTESPDSGAFNMTEIRRMVDVHDSQDYVCPVTSGEYAKFESKYPVGGMPWALPTFDRAEYQIMIDWVKNGARGPSEEAQAVVENPQQTQMSNQEPASVVIQWEQFLNGDQRSQLVARYLYEHAALANIQLAENPGEFYRIVRSTTPYPEKVEQIVTETVQDEPGISGRVYYRLQKIDRIIEAKTHVLWQLGLASLQQFQDLFFGEPWTLDKLPGYDSSNPFEVFEAIPALARARFMMGNSRMITQSIARGPVCFAQYATYGVDEYYWRWFLKPEADPSVVEPKLGLSSYREFWDYGLAIGSSKQKSERIYRDAFERTLRRIRPNGLSINDIWDGDGNNPNAWVPVRRHQNSVQIVNEQTPIPGLPHAIHLVSYATHERMYYNAAGRYRYWADALSKKKSWDWDVYTRTEAEDLFVSLFPNQAYRDKLRHKYTGIEGVLFFSLEQDYSRGRPANTRVDYTENTLARAVYKKMGRSVVGQEDRLNNWPNDTLPRSILPSIKNVDEWEMGLRTITGQPTEFAKFVPNIVHIRLDNQYLYSLTVVRGYVPNKMFLTEKLSRNPAQDIITATPGFFGVMPELFVDLSFEQASAFLAGFHQVNDLEGWKRFIGEYRIARNSPVFWDFVDWLHDWQEQHMRDEAGIIELRFYDRSDLPY